jgi:beta-lactamase class A
MGLFGRKDEDEEFEDMEEELEDREEPFRKIKDLRPENKRRRKEPPRPWDKKDRAIVLGVLVVTVLISGVLALSARDYKLPGLPRARIAIPNINLNFLGEKTIIIGNSQGSEADEAVKTALKKKAVRAEEAFKSITDSYSGLYAFYAIDLESGFSFGVNESETMQAASLIKLPVLSALYKDAEDGKVDLDAKYKLRDADKIAGSGSLSGEPAGTVLTYRDLARLMGKKSDNTAFNIVRKKLGDERINAEIGRIGMTATSLAENTTSPQDVGRYFQKLWGGELVSQNDRDEILGYLTDTIYENWLAAGVPENVRVAHKYGREVHVVNDAGIIYAPRPFVLVILTDGVVEREADEIFPNLTRAVYEALGTGD